MYDSCDIYIIAVLGSTKDVQVNEKFFKLQSGDIGMV